MNEFNRHFKNKFKIKCAFGFYLWAAFKNCLSLLAKYFCLTSSFGSQIKMPSSGTLRGMSASNHHQVQRADVDQDLVLMFSVVDENISWYLRENIQTFCFDPDGVDPARDDFQESNMMHGT